MVLSDPPPGSGIRALRGGGGNNDAGAVGPEAATEADGAWAIVRGCGSTISLATPTPATVAAASDPRNLRRFNSGPAPVEEANAVRFAAEDLRRCRATGVPP